MFVPRYSEYDARVAIADSFSYAEALRKLGLRPAGGNHRLFRHYVDDVWAISTDHFDPDHTQRVARRARATPLQDVLVEGSSYSRTALKRRLYAAGIKARECELCGQDEVWRGVRMGLVLDHINGVPDDNRLENLRIVCPNCAATFDTHCGRKNRIKPAPRVCLHCGNSFVPNYGAQKYCSRWCGTHSPAPHERPWQRKVARPPYEQLVAEIEALGYSAVGRKYSVSGSAVRKWIRSYRARPAGDGGEEAAA